jgi:hypothetical protein
LPNLPLDPKRKRKAFFPFDGVPGRRYYKNQREKAMKKLRVKRIIKPSTIITLILAAGLFVTLLSCSTRSFVSSNQKLEYLISGLVKNNKSVRNCVLFVKKGDGSFSWGAQRELPVKTVKCL